MKVRNLDEISDEILDFGWTNNNILDNIFGVSTFAASRWTEYWVDDFISLLITTHLF